MKHDLVTVTPLTGHRLACTLMDGRSGVVDLTPYLDHPGLARLRDADYFARVQILAGAATWPDGEDIAPDTLAAALAAVVPA